jgi:hypothetical protein
MTKGPFWLAVAAYLLPTFPLGYFWHLVTFHEHYERLAIYRPDVIIPFGLLSMAIQAVIFAASYPRLFDTAREAWWRGALGFFAVASVLSWSFTTLPVAAKFQMTSVPRFLLLETGFTLLQFAVVSPLVALALRQPRGVARATSET